MTLFHPKLREALLKEPKHRAAGLTPALLLEFEGLTAALFYAEQYRPPTPTLAPKSTAKPGAPPQKPDENASGGRKPQNNPNNPQGNVVVQQAPLEPLRQRIAAFRTTFLPEFDKIHDRWVKNQIEALSNDINNLRSKWVDGIIQFCKKAIKG